MPHHACCIAGSLIALVLLAARPAAAQQADPPQTEFAGKFLSIVKKSEPAFSYNLEKVEVKKLGNEYFLAGVGTDDEFPGNWMKGKTVWIALSDVSAIMVFSSLKDLRDMLRGFGADRNAARRADDDPLAAAEPGSVAELDYVAFDQRPGSGWRELAAAGRYFKGARAIDKYLQTRPELEAWQRINLNFHAGQLYAHAGHTETALERFRQAINPQEPADSPIRWNAYVRATIAFLKGDRDRLVELRDEIAAGPEFKGEVANLRVVDRMIEHFGEPYSIAYSGARPAADRTATPAATRKTP